MKMSGIVKSKLGLAIFFNKGKERCTAFPEQLQIITHREEGKIIQQVYMQSLLNHQNTGMKR